MQFMYCMGWKYIKSIGVLIALLLARRITQPIGAMIPILNEVAAANLSGEVPTHALLFRFSLLCGYLGIQYPLAIFTGPVSYRSS